MKTAQAFVANILPPTLGGFVVSPIRICPWADGGNTPPYGREEGMGRASRKTCTWKGRDGKEKFDYETVLFPHTEMEARKCPRIGDVVVMEDGERVRIDAYPVKDYKNHFRFTKVDKGIQYGCLRRTRKTWPYNSVWEVPYEAE